MSESEKIARIIGEINKKHKKKYGGDIIFNGNDLGNFKPLPTGFPTIDHINSGIGGLPRGGMTLIHGLESTGKTTFCLSTIEYNMMIDPNFRAFAIDAENHMTKNFLSFRGIDPSRMTLSQQNCEVGLAAVEEFIKADIFDMILIDSLAKLEAESIMELEMGESKQRAARATMISEFLRRIPVILRKSKCALVCINQEIDNQQKKTPYDPPTMLPCGKQQKFSANLRLELKRSSSIKSNTGERLGYQVSFTSLKNKIADKERALTKLTYLYKTGFSREFSVIDYLIAIKVIRKGTMGRFEFEDKNTYGKPFRPSEIYTIAREIKETQGIDLFNLKVEEMQYEKAEKTSEALTADEMAELSGKGAVHTSEESKITEEVEVDM